MSHEYFVNSPVGRPREHKAKFLREMTRDIILNQEWHQKRFEISRRSARLAAGPATPEAEDDRTVYEMKKNPVDHYMWDAVGACFPEATTEKRYFRYLLLRRHKGRWRIKVYAKRVRTVCAYSPVTMLCPKHYAAYRAARWDT